MSKTSNADSRIGNLRRGVVRFAVTLSKFTLKIVRLSIAYVFFFLSAQILAMSLEHLTHALSAHEPLGVFGWTLFILHVLHAMDHVMHDLRTANDAAISHARDFVAEIVKIWANIKKVLK